MKLAASAKLFKTLDEVGLVNYVFERDESFYLFDTDTGGCGLIPYFCLEKCDNIVNVFTDYRYCFNACHGIFHVYVHEQQVLFITFV